MLVVLHQLCDQSPFERRYDVPEELELSLSVEEQLLRGVLEICHLQQDLIKSVLYEYSWELVPAFLETYQAVKILSFGMAVLL